MCHTVNNFFNSRCVLFDISIMVYYDMFVVNLCEPMRKSVPNYSTLRQRWDVNKLRFDKLFPLHFTKIFLSSIWHTIILSSRWNHWNQVDMEEMSKRTEVSSSPLNIFIQYIQYQTNYILGLCASAEPMFKSKCTRSGRWIASQSLTSC